MAIFNSYVELPEGRIFRVAYFKTSPTHAPFLWMVSGSGLCLTWIKHLASGKSWLGCRFSTSMDQWSPTSDTSDTGLDIEIAAVMATEKDVQKNP